MYNDAIMVAHQFPIQQLGLEIQNLASPHRQRPGSILHISYTYRCEQKNRLAQTISLHNSNYNFIG